MNGFQKSLSFILVLFVALTLIIIFYPIDYVPSWNKIHFEENKLIGTVAFGVTTFLLGALLLVDLIKPRDSEEVIKW